MVNDFFDREVEKVIFEFNEKLSSNYIMLMIPEGFTLKMLYLEDQFTDAANRGDVNRFRELLNQWRMSWLSIMVKKSLTFH